MSDKSTSCKGDSEQSSTNQSAKEEEQSVVTRLCREHSGANGSRSASPTPMLLQLLQDQRLQAAHCHLSWELCKYPDSTTWEDGVSF